MNAEQVNRWLSKLSHELDALLIAYKKANEDWKMKEQVFAVAKARALLEAEGPMEARKAQALVVTSELGYEAGLAEAVFDNYRKAISVQQTKIDALRTAASSIRAEAIASGTVPQ